MSTTELPHADLSLLPALRERGTQLEPQVADMIVGFRMRFRDDREALSFSQHFRFAASRSALREEGDGVVWIGFHAWAFDAQDAQLQAALAVRYSAIQARIRQIPAATEAEVSTTGRRVLEPEKARAERDAFLARLDDPVPAGLYDGMVRTAAPRRRTLDAGSEPATVVWRKDASAPPPAFDELAQRRRRRRLFGWR